MSQHTPSSTKKSWLAWMINPKVILLSMVLGALVGIYHKDLAKDLAPFGKLYLTLLQMIIVPLVMTAIISSISSLLKSGKADRYLKTILFTFSFGLFLACVIGTTIAISFDVGSLSEEASRNFGKMIETTESASQTAAAHPVGTPNLFQFVKDMVPENIFHAISRGQNLAILFFSIIFGISLGMGFLSHGGSTAIIWIREIYDALLRLINAFMYGLPIGLFCIFADHVSHMGLEVFLALGPLILACFSGALAVIVISIFIIWRTSGESLQKVYAALREPVLVAIATSSSFACIPSSIKTMEKKLKFDGELVHLLVPMGASLNPVGAVLTVSIPTVFMAQVYDIPFDAQTIGLILMGSIFSAIAITGAPALGALSMLAIVTKPLGLPLEVMTVVLIATLPITEAVLTLANVMGNLGATAYISRPNGRSKVKIATPEPSAT